jgi:hypothetical protein
VKQVGDVVVSSIQHSDVVLQQQLHLLTSFCRVQGSELASSFGFKEELFFDAEEGVEKPVQVKF